MIFFFTLLYKVMLCNQWHIGVQERHLIFKDLYGHKKKVCLEQNISIGSIPASFHNFHNVSIYVKWPQKLVMF